MLTRQHTRNHGWYNQGIGKKACLKHIAFVMRGSRVRVMQAAPALP